jgi:hypothetical protein
MSLPELRERIRAMTPLRTVPVEPLVVEVDFTWQLDPGLLGATPR